MNKPLRKLLGLLQHGKQIQQASPTYQRPPLKTPEEWRIYWREQGLPWRTEPEIDAERQKYLGDRRSIKPNIEQGIYPFKGIKLSRADVEWLLATHENGRGPVDWSDENQRERWGLDLRGANLYQMNLHNLPLARLRGGLTWEEWLAATDAQRDMAGVNLAGTNLFRTHLEGARLRRAHLEEASLNLAHLEEAYLEEAHLERTNLFRTHFEGTDLRGSHLEDAVLYEAFFDTGTNLRNAIFGKAKLGSPLLTDVHWGGVNLASLNWSQVNILGDEYVAQQKKRDGTVKDKGVRLKEYGQAARANRQLAVALQAQGLNEDAARFAYRAQVLQKSVLWFQMTQQGVTLRQRMQTLGAWLFSWSLFLLAGYGYRVWRSFAAYVLVIGGFATAYYLLGPRVGLPLSCVDAIVFSMTSFHGRGFAPGENIGLSNPLAILAAIEAFVGLVIEITLIATLTQRFFGK